jgi:hypothetical protein
MTSKKKLGVLRTVSKRRATRFEEANRFPIAALPFYQSPLQGDGL